ncbi:MAG: hypothetical protein K0S32_4199, partial [Bacteroidetes bacterium]|nr:hypothetical protein [Bacteroidota bacterium]
NEHSQILTSMNLYDYSQDENIEVGVKTEFSSLKNLLRENNIDQQAWEYFNEVIDKSDLLFQRIPEYDNGLLGFGKKYKDSKTTLDKISEHFTKANSETSSLANVSFGYCIRTGEQIPFNPAKPYSDKAYKSWAQYKNQNYKEKYCHKTGKPSEGKTSMANPIL